MANETKTPTAAAGTGWVNPQNIEQSGVNFASYSIPAAPPSGGGGTGGGGQLR